MSTPINTMICSTKKIISIHCIARTFLSAMRVNNKGFTLLEMTVVTALFIVVLLQIGGMWSSLNGWMTDLIKRANIDREARIAREFLLQDLIVADNITSGPFYGWSISFSGPVSSANYYADSGMLIRRGRSMLQTFPAAYYLSDSEFLILADNNASAELTFQSEASQVMLSVFMNTIADKAKTKTKGKKKVKDTGKKKVKKK